MRLTLGISINQEPFGQARQFAPFLSALEHRLEQALKHPVLIDLRLYKSETNSIRDAARGQLDLQRMGALPYVLAKQIIPGLEPIVRERTQKDAVIFASKESGISNLTQVAGHRVAFGQTNSTISFWAKVHLARAGVHGTNLQSYVHLSGVRPGRDEIPSRPKGSEDRDSETQAHKQVIQEVSLSRADVGEAPRRPFELNRYRHGGLVPLLVYRVPSEIYVARPGLDPEVVRAVQESLVAMQSQWEKDLIAQLAHNIPIQGFETARDDDFNDIRSAMRREIEAFERGARPGSLETKP